MTALYIFTAVVAVLALLLFWPVSATIDFDKTFRLYIRLLGIKLPLAGYEKQRKAKKEKSETKQKKAKEEKKKKDIVIRLKKRFKHDGTAATLKVIIGAAKNILSSLGRMISKISVRDLRLSLDVASDDAALTAVEYGAVCGVVYPFLDMLTTCADFKAKKIDIRADFQKNVSSLAFHLTLKIKIITLLITAWAIYKEYKKITEDQEQ